MLSGHVLLPVRLALLLALAWTAGCAGLGAGEEIPTYRAAPGGFEVEIKGFGELQAAQATPIEVPPNLPGAQRVVSLAEDGTTVAEGDVIARLDDDYIQTRIDRARDMIASIDLQLEAKEKDLAKEKSSVTASLEALERQLDNADNFAPRDPELFSRNEILEAEVDRELLATKIRLARERLERYTERAEAELEILRLKRRTQKVQQTQFEEARKQLDVRAPHAGVFFRAANWRGEKMSVGNTVWRGTPLGELPNLDEMEARLHVLESEAAGLTEGLDVNVTLDAHPGIRFAGKVSTVQPIANPIEPESPVKYFELKIALDRTDGTVMKPRSQVVASIFVVRHEGVIAVPNQALFHEGGETWVWVRRRGGFERQIVQLGERSLSQTVITDGVREGDVIALSPPSGSADTEAG